MAGSRTIAPKGNCPPTPKLTLPLTPTLTEEKYSSGAIVWLPSNSKANPKLDPNPNPNRAQISSGGNYPDIDMVSGAIVWTPIYLFIYFHFILSWQNTYEFKYIEKLLAMQKIINMIIKVN